jgi:hypothetical protein
MPATILSAPADALALAFLEQEAQALLTRLERVRPFVLYETMVLAAAPSVAAQAAIERYLAQGRKSLRDHVRGFLEWLHGAEAHHAPAAEAQRKFTLIRLHFNAILAQFDTFAEVITQRSEHSNGVWMAGLDVVAADALALPGGYFTPPPVLCYLQRGQGAAIRRARTRLPGGGATPVAIIMLPRERMIGSGIASSLVHEVGHQGAAQLGLVASLLPTLRGLQHSGGEPALVWRFWQRWLGEIVSDLWSVARVGVAGTLGLIGVMSLPAPFVFRVSLDDPHPIPWIRVKLSAAMGAALYPDPQWAELEALWEALYPRWLMPPETHRLLTALERGIPAFVAVLVNHRPRSLQGNSLQDVLAGADRRPASLRALFDAWSGSRLKMQAAPPALVFAVIGQAKADGRLTAHQENQMLNGLLADWAMRRSLDATVVRALPGATVPALTT